LSGLTGRVGQAMAWSVVARAGRFVLGLASSVIVVRSLGAEDYGVLSLVRTLLMFAAIIAGAGLGNALLKFLPALRVERSAAGTRALMRTSLATVSLVWVVLVGATYAARGALENLFPYEGLDVIVTAAVALSLFEVLFTLMSRVLEANYDTRRLSVAALTGHVVFIAALVVVLPEGWGVLGVVAAAAAGNAVSCLMVLTRWRASVPEVEGKRTETGVSYGRLARFSAPFVAIGILNLVVWRQSETMFLAHYRTAAETGFFDLAYRFPQTMLEFVPGAVWPLVMAGFSEVFARNASDVRHAIDRYYRMLFLLCAPICVTGIVLGGRIVPILFGESMIPAAIPTQLFFAVFTLSFFGTPLSMTLYVLEKTHLNLIVYLCLAAANLGLDFALIPRFGVAGAVVPVAIVTAASPFVYRILVRRYVEAVRIPWGFIGKCFLASGSVVLLVPFLRWVTGLASLVVACGAAVLLTLAAFKWARVLSRGDLDSLGAIPIPGVERLLRFIAS
jgi:O-antigen/teichoic acid export membrane protein